MQAHPATNATNAGGTSLGQKDSSARGSQSLDGSNKRRRIGLACRPCRGRKSRCDGARPKCSACDQYGNDCHYQQTRSSANVVVGKEYLSSVEDRLNELEKLLGSVARQVNLPREIEQQTRHNNETENNADTGSLDGDAEADGDAEDIDGMGLVSFAEDEICSFFGPSSNIIFIRHISRALARMSHTFPPWVLNETPDHGSLGDSTFINVSWPTSIAFPHANGLPQANQVDVHAVPSQELADEMVTRYFTIMQRLFPYLHEESFRETYAQVKSSNYIRMRKAWLALLNMMFAMATSSSTDGTISVEKRMSDSEIYYQRACGLCIPQVLRGRRVNLEIVLCLLLMSQYLQGTQGSVQPWVVHGLAVKAALQLGLHSLEASKSFPPIEQEVRKRAWFGIVNLDRTLGMTFGRPSVIPQSHVELELPAPYQSIVPVPQSTPRTSHDQASVTFFNATINLYEIMAEVINQLYGQNLGCEKDQNAVETVARVYKEENRLMAWQQKLPSHLLLLTPSELRSEELDDEVPDTWLIDRLRVVLTLRYLNLRILLYRPVLVKFLDVLQNDSLDRRDLDQLQQTGPNCIQVCVSSSVDLITLVHSIVCSTGRRHQLLGAWWFSLYYTFNATLVILASLLVSRTEKSVEAALGSFGEGTRHCIDQAIETMRHLDAGNRLVARCQGYLEQLTQTLGSLTSHDDGITMDPQAHRPESGNVAAAQPDAAFPETGQPVMDFGEYLFPVTDMQEFNGDFSDVAAGISDLTNVQI